MAAVIVAATRRTLRTFPQDLPHQPKRAMATVPDATPRIQQSARPTRQLLIHARHALAQAATARWKRSAAAGSGAGGFRTLFPEHPTRYSSSRGRKGAGSKVKVRRPGMAAA